MKDTALILIVVGGSWHQFTEESLEHRTKDVLLAILGSRGVNTGTSGPLSVSSILADITGVLRSNLLASVVSEPTCFLPATETK